MNEILNKFDKLLHDKIHAKMLAQNPENILDNPRLLILEELKTFINIHGVIADLGCGSGYFGIGTANIALSLEPIIAKTAQKARIQPKRALTASVLTANLALLCSPAASATAYIISVLAGYEISMGKYLSIVLPTALISMLMLSTFCTFVGRKEHVRDES